MKQNILIPVLTLVIGIGIGVAVDRTIVVRQDTTPHSTQGDQPLGPRAMSGDRSPSRPDASAEAGEGVERNPAATVRRIKNQLDLSPMINMDFEALLKAYQAIRWMNPEEVRLALAELDGKPSMTQSGMMLRMMLMDVWAKNDGQGALEYSLEIDQPNNRMMGVMSSMMSWMKHEPHQAYDWFRNNRDQLKGGGIFGGSQMESLFIAALSQQDMGVAFHEIVQLKGNQRESAISMVAGSAGMDPVKRGQFIEQLKALEDEELRESGYQSLISTWALQDPKGAAEYLEGLNPEMENYEQLQQSLASSWSMIDPEGAVKWQLERVPEGESAGDKIADVFGNWVSNDPKAAAEWLEAQPEELRTDELYREAARNSAWGADPASGTQFAVRIKDENERQMALSNLYDSMKMQGEDQLEQWLEGLEPAMRDDAMAFAEGKDDFAEEAVEDMIGE
ncbi:MAG: hypothetical protein R3242_09155 [Akkermansiaceae bacterium]|nr:hypothetical protein [Akkermansiaceae bacterium]